VFADGLTTPWGITIINNDTIAVAVRGHEDGIHFYDYSGNEYPDSNHHTEARYMSVVDKDTIIFTYDGNYVESFNRFDHSQKGFFDLEPDSGVDLDLRGIASLNADEFLVVVGIDQSIMKCAMDTQLCSIWLNMHTNGLTFDPTNILIFEDLVYVTDGTANKVYVLTLDGHLISSLPGINMGDMASPTQLAIRPGLYAPFSSVITGSTVFTAVAGEELAFPLDYRDCLNNSITVADGLPFPNRLTTYV